MNKVRLLAGLLAIALCSAIGFTWGSRTQERLEAVIPRLPSAGVVHTTENMEPSAGVERVLQQAPATPTEPPMPTPEPITDETDAIERSEVELGFEPTGVVARHVISTTFWSWIDAADLNPSGSIWVVGLTRPDLTVKDILMMYNPGTKDDEVEGAYVAWDADTGMLRVTGVLDSGAPQNLSSLEALPNDASAQ